MNPADLCLTPDGFDYQGRFHPDNDVYSLYFDSRLDVISLARIHNRTLAIYCRSDPESIVVGASSYVFESTAVKRVAQIYVELARRTFQHRWDFLFHKLTTDGFVQIGCAKLTIDSEIEMDGVKLSLIQAARDRTLAIGTYVRFGTYSCREPNRVILSDPANRTRIDFLCHNDYDVVTHLLTTFAGIEPK